MSSVIRESFCHLCWSWDCCLWLSLPHRQGSCSVDAQERVHAGGWILFLQPWCGLSGSQEGCGGTIFTMPRRGSSSAQPVLPRPEARPLLFLTTFPFHSFQSSHGFIYLIFIEHLLALRLEAPLWTRASGSALRELTLHNPDLLTGLQCHMTRVVREVDGDEDPLEAGHLI